MAICKPNFNKAIRMIGIEDARWIWRCAKKQETLESQWMKKFKERIQQYNIAIVKGENPVIDFTDILMEHFYNSSKQASADKQMPSVRLAKVKSLANWQKIWDYWKSKKKVPKKIKKHADEIKREYLKKTKQYTDRYSRDFREGKEFTQDFAIKKIEDLTDSSYARAKTIVRTETTNYYNKARKELYDQSTDVTHYLFLAIRDMATTKWCTEHRTPEGRGRHGLVYEKGDPLTERETPAIHWNCRSEMVPLTPLNPKHAELINDTLRQRKNNKCTPLPRGWE